MSLLPAAFAALEPFADEWVLADSRARAEKRQASTMDDIRAFYDAALALAPDALTYLAERRLGELDDPDERLLKLMLSLAEVGPAVEWYGQPAVIDGFDAARFPLTEQLSDTASQE
ncbi:MAG: hypothetical protein ACU85V_16990 [Gammaproteobacteria bacterium]